MKYSILGASGGNLFCCKNRLIPGHCKLRKISDGSRASILLCPANCL